MKKNPLTYIGFMFILILTLSILSTSVQASDTVVYPTKDSYVNSYHPNKNFGGQPQMECGTFYVPATDTPSTQACEAYLYFDLSEVLKDWSKVELYLDFYSVSEAVEFEIIKIIGNWDEDLITWINKPAQGEIMLSLTILDDMDTVIDISSHVSSNKFSICIDSPYYQDELVKITAKEDNLELKRPRLIFYYTNINFNPIPRFIESVIAIFAIALIIWVVKHQKRKRIGINQHSQELNEPKKPIGITQPCPECGSNHTIQDRYCYKCGIKLSK
ncbi:MAG: DNRLRE domain-containing protein [Promethearchaeota archaeon]